MPNPLPPAMLMLLVVPGPTAAQKREPAAKPPGFTMTQLTIRQRIVIRVPRVAPGPVRASRSSLLPPPMMDTLKLQEKKGPKCVPIQQLAGSGVARKDSVDLMMVDGTLLRARLGNDCPTLDFYAGLYLRQTADGMLCGDRDVIRARSGRACPITSFKKLKAKK